MDGSPGLVHGATEWLCRLQGAHGTWSDFYVTDGASTSWVTAYAAHALLGATAVRGLESTVANRALSSAGRALDALEGSARYGAWGWNPTTRPDADSTAWAVRALLAGGRPVGERTWDFLESHRIGGDYRTYRATPWTGRWAAPTPEVSAVVLAALAAGCRIDPADHAQRWSEMTGIAASSHWWLTCWQPIALIASTRPQTPGGNGAAAPRTDRHLGAAPTPTGVGDAAAQLWFDACTGGACDAGVEFLTAARHPAGGWAGDTVLLVPAQGEGGTPTHTRDGRGVFTTATVLHAAVAATCAGPTTGRGAGSHRSVIVGPGKRLHNGTSAGGSANDVRCRTGDLAHDQRWGEGLARVSAAAGVGDATVVLDTFAELTRESLSGAIRWPCPQLSVLAAGLPIEYSATGRPGVRFTTEVGDPRLPPASRVASGLTAVGRAAQHLGVAEGWAAAAPLVATLTSAPQHAPEVARFGMWAGADVAPNRPPALKAYLSLYAGEVEGWRDRLSAAFSAGGVPGDAMVWEALTILGGSGWGHEVGVGVDAAGRWGIKVYYELDRWRPDLVAQLLGLCGLNGHVPDLAPDIPGVLRASTSRAQRSGIALRVDPATGDVSELTTAAALPVPLVGRAEVNDRVITWLDDLGRPSEPLRCLMRALAPTWVGATPTARMLSLVTRTVGRTGQPTVTVYVRQGHGGTCQVWRDSRGSGALYERFW